MPQTVRIALAGLLTLVLLIACGTPEGPLQEAEVQNTPEANRYIVVLHDRPVAAHAARGRDQALDFAQAQGLRPDYAYGAALVGFAAPMTPQRAEALARNPRVALVEEDRPFTIAGHQGGNTDWVPTGVRRVFAHDNDAIAIDGHDDVRVDATVAVLDTGIDLTHGELHVVAAVDCTVSSGGPPWSRSYTCSSDHGTGGDDDHGHGTHVAGTVAALDGGEVVGVAPGARLVAVKVLDKRGSGSTQGIVAGIDWIAENAIGSEGAGLAIQVANMSLSGAFDPDSDMSSDAMYQAIEGAVSVGVAFAVAAGNDGIDASNRRPAAFDNVLTTSALADFDGLPGGLAGPTCRNDVDDTLANFSNFGPAVDIAAPGVCIYSTMPNGSYDTFSGTSMAAPHAAGALALLASANPVTDAAGVKGLYGVVTEKGNSDWVDTSGDGVHEPLLDVGDATVFAPVLSDGSTGGDGSDGGDGGDGGGDPGDDPDAGAVTLTVEAYKVRGLRYADLAWNGTSAEQVVVIRDGADLATVDDTGAYTDFYGGRGGGSAAYQVCEAIDAGACSEVVIANW